MTRYLDVHHVKYQSLGGGHDMTNTILLCTGHHAAVHKDKLRIMGKAPDDIIFEFVGREQVAELAAFEHRQRSNREVPWDNVNEEVPWDDPK